MKSYVLALLATLLLMSNAASAQRPPIGFEVGQLFPDLVLPSLEHDRPMSISQFRGQKLILHIFASW